MEVLPSIPALPGGNRIHHTALHGIFTPAACFQFFPLSDYLSEVA